VQIGSKRDFSIDELRRMLVDKHRSVRRARLDYFRRTGQVNSEEQTDRSTALKSLRTDSGENLLGGSQEKVEVRKRSPWMDRALLLVEFGAVAGLLVVLFNGLLMVQNINREMVSVLEQPTLQPTALIMAVVLPSGHTPPNSPDGVRPNDAEIPEHLRPLVQSLADLPVPTPGPKQAIRIQIPAIGIDYPVVQGDGWEQLKKGIAQRLGTPDPGETGNMVVSAHNDIFGEIFRDLDKLQDGDTVVVFTSQRTYTYVVRQTQVVEPTQVEVMAPTQEPVITLISCYPYMVDNQRIVVTAFLQE
jgi:sortase A